MSDNQEPVFQIQRVYLKEASLEQPNSPAILLEQEQPAVDIQLGVEALQAADGIFEVCVTATVTTKVKDKTVFLVEVKQAGIFEIRNLSQEQMAPIMGIACPQIVYPYLRGNVADLITRAGGLTQWADANQTMLVRAEDNRGLVFMDLDKALKDPGSRYNLLLKAGDEITVPVTNDIVTISGNINFPYRDTLGFLNAPWKEGKRAKWYIKKYGLGFADGAKKVRTYVIQPGGVVEDPQRLTFIRIYPKVQKGASVVVPYIAPKPNSAEAAAAAGQPPPKPIDWNQVIESAMIKITGLLTLYVLVSRINF